MSNRSPDLDIGINSEICEQFNASIPKINKYSAQSMNQSFYILSPIPYTPLEQNKENG